EKTKRSRCRGFESLRGHFKEINENRIFKTLDKAKEISSGRTLKVAYKERGKDIKIMTAFWLD
ncbi:MAG: hypothetical protein ABIJ58_02190, partial [Nanoarchaeota archaeon]